MIYQDFKNEKLSALGFGGMRLPTIGEGFFAPVNQEEAAQMVDGAIKNGVNYFDTAYGYHGGDSERAMGEILKNYPRDSFYLASKFPGYEVRESWDAKAQFEEQLEKCGVDYFDFYLIHNVYERNIEVYFDERWGIVEYLIEQKKNGRIKHLGFSTHGLKPTIERFLERYGEHMEFCQIQLNYLDWKLQKANEIYEMLVAKNIPIWVMEPVRGGALASFSEENTNKLRELRPNESTAAWAFRFLQGLSGIKMILSGMSNMEQLQDNLKTFEDSKPLNEKELAVVEEIRDGMLTMLPCTACKYCCSECPQELDIPTLLHHYNDHKFQPGFIAPMAIAGMAEDKRPSACIECGQCKQVCLQNIDIPAALKDFQKMLDEDPAW
ncbi:oxidoreductase [Acetobacterium wieringae]|uniref:Oxidoreductase n=1 Tax=Acetobacterium wieringae TaxID=52694 RepID=A0A5D0WHD1_9FIRM|nr:aldo/keto reductase [Acetobacterium wieringae]TYC83655.1 oxidoreductase [Acetobacterium wieringae]